MTRAPDPRLDLHNLGPLSREDAAALLDSLPRDPLYVPEDALVERRGGPTERRARRRGHSTLALIAFLIAGLILGALVHATLAASRGAHVIPAATVRDGEPDRGLPEALAGASPILEPLLTASPAPRPAVEQPTAELKEVAKPSSRPVVVLAPTSGTRGSASWYDDPRKAGMYAAAGPALRIGDWRGRTVTVCASTCFAVVLSDFCGCPGGRVIDLSSTAYAPGAPDAGRGPGDGDVVSCAHTDCPNAGTRRPTLLVSPADHPNYTGEPARLTLGIFVCDIHQEGTTAADFIVDEGWAQIEAAFALAHKARPNRDTVGLAWTRPDVVPDTWS